MHGVSAVPARAAQDLGLALRDLAWGEASVVCLGELTEPEGMGVARATSKAVTPTTSASRAHAPASPRHERRYMPEKTGSSSPPGPESSPDGPARAPDVRRERAPQTNWPGDTG